MQRRARCLVALALAAFAVSAGTAAAIGRTPRSAGRVRATVMLLGDSNITRGAWQISQALQYRDDGYLVSSIARPGTAIRTGDCPFWQDTICSSRDYWKVRARNARAASDVDVWVVDLGINDAELPGTPTTTGYADYGAKIDWLLAQLGTKPVIWTNLPCPIEPAAWRHGCAIVNAALASARARHENLQVVDWASIANHHRNWIDRGVHLNATGYLRWAQLVAGRLDARFAMP